VDDYPGPPPPAAPEDGRNAGGAGVNPQSPPAARDTTGDPRGERHGPRGASPQTPKSPGLAGGIARMFVRSPVTPLLYIMAFFFGLIGFFQIPYQQNPQISVPFVDIFVSYPGASPNQVERLVTDPLELLMTSLQGVRHVYGVSEPGRSMVTVRFAVGQHATDALQRLYTKIFSHLNAMPAGASQPLVVPKGVNSVPFFNVTLWSKTMGPARLDDIGQVVLQELMTIPGTADGFTVHGQREEVQIHVLPSRLNAYGIPLTKIAEVIRTANLSAEVGHITQSNHYLKVYTGKFLSNPQEIENLVVGVYHGSPVYLDQVAKVTFGAGAPNKMVQFFAPGGVHHTAVNGAPAVTIAIAKKSGANTVVMAHQILANLKSFEGTIIPSDVHVTVSRNEGKSAEGKVNELLFKLVLETSLVAFLVFLVLGWRPAFVTLLIIPVVILFTIFLAQHLGYTLNRVSLFALILTIAILVDDAIVVVENIYRRWLEAGRVTAALTIDAVREVGNPTIVATLTVVVALLPMAFVRGMMGPYMIAIPILGSAAMIFSLFAAFVFTPYLIQKIPPNMARMRRAGEREHRQSRKLAGFYKWMMDGLLAKAWRRRALIGLIVMGLAGVGALFYFDGVIMTMLPEDNVNHFDVVLSMRAGTPVEETYNTARAMIERIDRMRYVRNSQLYVGAPEPFSFNGMVRHYYLRDKPWQAMIHVELNDRRPIQSHAVALRAVANLDALAKTLKTPIKSVQVVESPPGPPVRRSVVAVVYGPDQQARDKFAAVLAHDFGKARSIGEVDSSLEYAYPVWHFKIDQLKAAIAGVDDRSIKRSLELALNDETIASLPQGGTFKTVPVKLSVPMGTRAEAGKLLQLPVSTDQGSAVPLSEVGTPKLSHEEPTLLQRDLRSVAYVTGASIGQLAAPIYGMLEVDTMLQKAKYPTCTYTAPPTDVNKVGCYWTGSWTVTFETFLDMGIAFGVAFFLIYMVLAAEFRGLVMPVVIMVPIFLTMLGIVPGHWLFGAPFTATSMIGFIALMGIIVRNSILLVDFAQHAVIEGATVREAVVAACAARTRPILITAAVLMIGSMFIISSPIFQGMGLSLLFGTLVSTLLTLIVVPLGINIAGNYLLPHEMRRQADDEGEPEAPPAQPVPAGPAASPYGTYEG